MRAKRGLASIGKPLASRRLERRRHELCALRATVRRMRTHGRGKRRGLSVARALGAGAAAFFAASLAWAGAPEARPDRGGAIALLSPEAPASFGKIGDVSPVVAAFNAVRASQDEVALPNVVGEPRFDVSAVAAAASSDETDPTKVPLAYESGFARDASALPLRRPPPPRRTTRRPRFPNPSPLLRSRPVRPRSRRRRSGSSLAPDQPNPLGAGDWRAARAAIAFFYAARAYAPVWVGVDGLTEAGRARAFATETRQGRRPHSSPGGPDP